MKHILNTILDEALGHPEVRPKGASKDEVRSLEVCGQAFEKTNACSNQSPSRRHTCGVIPQDYLRLLVAIVLLLFSFTSYATIITVKQDGSGNYITIQAGINASSTGDTVLVWPGIYYENIDYNSISITLASLYLTTQDDSYIHTTIIDGGNNGSCVVISNSTGNNTTLCGFTIQHGSGYSSLMSGGGIYIVSSKIKIESCIIQENYAKTGGGIFGGSSEINLAGSVIRKNHAITFAGGVLITYGTLINFDTINLNSIYLNYGPRGCDFTKSQSCPPLKIVLDTGSVIVPDNFFYYSYDPLGLPLNDITWQINHGKVDQVIGNLFVDPNGDNSNSGLSQNEPLESICYAMRKMYPDTAYPKSIFLAPGNYSPSSNSEIFPVIPRSYCYLIGSLAVSTIIDAEHLAPLLESSATNKNILIKNMSFIRGIDNQAIIAGNGGLDFYENDSIYLQKIYIEQTIGSGRSGFDGRSSNLILQDVTISNNSGDYPLVLGNYTSNMKYMLVLNSIIEFNGPGTLYEEGKGGAVGFIGSYSYPSSTLGSLINVQINENVLSFEPGSSDKAICGVSCSNYARVNVINSTIGNNIVVNPVNSAQVYAAEGAEINFYNSIIYGTENYEMFLGDGTPTSNIATVNISNTNVKGGESNIQNWNNIHVLNWLGGNINEDPLWEGGEPFSYALQPGSPCIDAGVPMYETGMDYPYIKEEDGKYMLYMLEGDTVTLPALDLAGNPRISGGKIDMGAYEWQDTATEVQKFRVQGSEFGVYPNPFTSNVFISFSLKQEAAVRLEVINIKGQPVKIVADAGFPAGNYKLVWNGKDNDGYAVKKGNYLMCLYINGTLVDCEKQVKSN